MKRFFITGISGVGKSSVSDILNQRGIFSIDIDAVKDLCNWRDKDTLEMVKWHPGMTEEWFKKHKYICDKEKLINLMDNHKEVVVVVGLPSNHSDLWNLFDKVFLLQCKEGTFIERIKERTSHDFGKHILDRENLLSWYQNFENKMLKRGAIPINTDRSISEVVDDIVNML